MPKRKKGTRISEAAQLPLLPFGALLNEAQSVPTKAPTPLHYSVGEITQHLQALLNEDPIVGSDIIIRGELSNVNPSSRGHVYFTMKDEQASLRAVVWASMANRIAFDLEDGLEVYATGRIEIYGPSGTYSLICKKIEPVGMGALQLAFEQIKQRLSAQGFFDEAHKQALPLFPKRVGIVTSATGAVIHDMLRTIRHKNQVVDILLAPVAVQGESAAEQIAAAITRLNDTTLQLDCIIVARGGGSFEDLFCFSDEAVVKAIYHSKLPVVTGIGHEPDYTLADAAADFSAATPTAAAETTVPDISQLQGELAYYQHVLVTQWQHAFQQHQQQLQQHAHRFLGQLQQFQQFWQSTLQLRQQQLVQHAYKQLDTAQHQVSRYADNLNAYSPLNTLARGYAYVSTPEGASIRSVKQASPGQEIIVRLTDGPLHCEVLSP